MTILQPSNHLVNPFSPNTQGGSALPGARQFQPFPKWKYHATESAKTVLTPEQENALGEGWYDTPSELQAALANPQKLDPAPPASPDNVSHETVMGETEQTLPDAGRPRKSKK